MLDRGGEPGHSVFASAFLRQLRRNTAIIDMDRLSDEVIHDVEEVTSTTSRQKPRYYMIPPAVPIDERGDFVFMPEGVDLGDLL